MEEKGSTGFVVARTLAFGLIGSASGGLSVFLMGEFEIDTFDDSDWLPVGRSSWVPGAVYGLVLLAIVLLQRPLRIKGRCHRRPLWLALLPLASTAAHYTAFFTSFQVIFRVTGESGPFAYPVAGFVGGIPGSIGLALGLSTVVLSLRRWWLCGTYVICGGLLGILLTVFTIEDGLHVAGFDQDTVLLCLFYIGWQGAMLMVLSILDACSPRGHGLDISLPPEAGSSSGPSLADP